jgi:hypothetical protein
MAIKKKAVNGTRVDEGSMQKVSTRMLARISTISISISVQFRSVCSVSLIMCSPLVLPSFPFLLPCLLKLNLGCTLACLNF